MTALFATVRLAVLSVARASVRSVLTALGILIGIAAVVVVVALGEGAREQIGGRIESLGSNVIYVFDRPVQKSGVRAQVRTGVTVDDAEAIRREASAVKAVTVYTSVERQVVTPYANARTSIVGGDRFYFDVRGYRIDGGRSFTRAEEKTKAKVGLIGKTAVEKLFGVVNPIGKFVRIGKHPFLIIGTLGPKGQSPFGSDQDDRIVVPIGSWRARVQPTPGGRVHIVMASARSSNLAERAASQIEAIMRQRHRIGQGEEDDFRVRSQARFRQMQDRIVGILTVLLVSVAAVALFVGGVGVMNIMLVNVTERRREIGVRMALGAKPGDIQLQFLIEALVLTGLGGVAGLALAVGLIELARRKIGWSMALSWEAVVVALATSLFVGIVFGLLPARRAARLEPMEALRHE